MSMSRRNYEEIAYTLRISHPSKEYNRDYVPKKMQWEVMVHAIAEMLQSDNPRFNKDIFYAACQYME